MTSLVMTNGISPFLALPLSFLAHGAMLCDYSHYTFVTHVAYSYHHADSYHCWKSCRVVSVNKKLADNMVTKEKKRKCSLTAQEKQKHLAELTATACTQLLLLQGTQ